MRLPDVTLQFSGLSFLQGRQKQIPCGNDSQNGNSKSESKATAKAAANYIGFSQFTIHGMPKRSTSMPKRLAQKVSCSGMCVWPPAASA